MYLINLTFINYDDISVYHDILTISKLSKNFLIPPDSTRNKLKIVISNITGLLSLLESVLQNNSWRVKLTACLINYSSLEIEKTIAKGMSVTTYVHACIDMHIVAYHEPYSDYM